jgi:hypothetical protein
LETTRTENSYDEQEEFDVGFKRDGEFEQAPLAAERTGAGTKGPPRNLTALAEQEGDPVV